MRQYQDIIGILTEKAAHPEKAAKELKESTGKKAIGCFPEYVPGELVYAAGMLPIGLWGGNVNISAAKAYVPAFCCTILQADLELGLTGRYKDLEAVIVPSLCDSLKCMAQNFKVGVKDVRMIQFAHPQLRKIEAGVQFLKSEYGRVLEALEEISGTKVSNDAIAEAIRVFNDNRKALRNFVELAREHTDVITPAVRHDVIKSGYFMEKPEHTELVNELCAGLETLPKKLGEKPVLLSGIIAEPSSLLEVLEQSGLSVAADDLAHETRQFRYDVPVVGNDALYNLAKWWQVFEGCSLAYDPEKKRTDMIIDEVTKNDIKGVIFLIMKFCDPEEYDYPLIKEALDANGIPSLYFEVDQPSDINAQATTRIQAFSEIL